MSTYVSDGILLGVVVDETRVKKEISEYTSHKDALDILAGINQNNSEGYSLDGARQHLQNVIKLNGESAIALSQINDPYSSSSSKYYIGFFWEWGNRQAMSLDDKWKPLYQELKNSNKAMKEPKNVLYKQRIFEIAEKIVKDLDDSEIKLFEVRFFD